MSHARRCTLVALLGLLVAAIAAPAAPAKSLLRTTLASDDAKKRRCHARLATGEGVVRRTVRLREASLVRAGLTARGGDWDLGLFDAATRRAIGGSAGFGSRNELAEGFAPAGRVIVQACRRKGGGERARLSVRSFAVPEQREGDRRQVLQLVRIATPSRADKQRLAALGIDLTEHGDAGHLEAVLHGPADAAKLRAAGFDYVVQIPDLFARSVRNSAADVRFAQRTRRSSLPSGRDEYRRLPDFEADMKRLAEQRPELVKPITLPNRSLEGRTITGIEITEDVGRATGKPVYLQMGIHHAREWPSGELPMEFAIDLVEGFGSDERITRLMKGVRTIVVPVINPDGYNLSREAAMDLQVLGVAGPALKPVVDALAETGALDDSNTMGLGSVLKQTGANPGAIAAIHVDAQTQNFAYKRRNCRVTDGEVPAPGECALGESRPLGTDPNRNYGGFWGGPGASADPTIDSYRGGGPFSEPEVDNVRRLVSGRQVTTLITNHTYSNLVLRPPGLIAEGRTPDEDVYKALGDAMGRATGFSSEYSYQLYDTTGTTEDWSYYQTGGLGFTFEIGPHEFHPPFEQVVAEYVGAQPTPIDGVFAQPKAGGVREAYLLAMESAADSARHSVVTGRAPAGSTLEVAKSHDFLTSRVVDGEGVPGAPLTLSDTLTSSIDVPADGAFEWHLNPSTRPYAKKDRFVIEAAEEPTSTEPISGGPATQTFPVDIAEGDAVLTVNVDLGDTDDYDLYLYRGDGVDPEQQVASGSNGFVGEDEVLTASSLEPGRYTLEVRNFAASTPWTGTMKKYPAGRTFGFPARTEAWKLTCRTPDGAVAGTREIVVERGQRLDLGTPCGASATADGGAGGLLTASDGGARRAMRLDLSARRVKVGTLRRRGVALRMRCTETCDAASRLTVTARTARALGLSRKRRGAVVIGRGRTVRIGADRTRTVRVRLTRRAARAARGTKRLNVRLAATARQRGGNRVTKRAELRFTARR